jgi:hypothetical protein
MKQVLAALLIVCSVSAHAVDLVSLFTPSPIGIIIAVRSYFKDQNKVYYIQVKTQAETFEQAKQQAFRLASEQVAGTVVLSESELHNNNITRNEIITYSSGIVDEYRIVNRVDQPGQVDLTVDIWIAESAMAQRLLAKSATATEINGDQLGARAQSILDQHHRGDNIFRAILRDFPKRAFLVKMSQPNLSIDPVRNILLSVDVNVNWDKKFTDAFYEAAQRTGSKPCVLFCGSTPRFYIQGWEFNDAAKLLLIDQHISQTRLSLKLEVIGTQGNIVKQLCYHMPDLKFLMMYNVSNNQLALWEKPYVSRLQVDLGQNINTMSNVKNVRVEVVPNTNCIGR